MRWKLLNKVLHNLCPSPIIIRVIKSRRMRWAEHVARRGIMNAYRILVDKSEWDNFEGIVMDDDNIKTDFKKE
jgi:hypothetical protein